MQLVSITSKLRLNLNAKSPTLKHGLSEQDLVLHIMFHLAVHVFDTLKLNLYYYDYYYEVLCIFGPLE